MSQYEPNKPPTFDSFDDMAKWVFDEMLQISKAIGGIESIIMPQTHVDPVKTNDGEVLYADGADWDPDTGKGIYYFDGSEYHRLLDFVKEANGTTAVTLTSLGPATAQTTVQGWLKVNINGTDRFIPFW